MKKIYYCLIWALLLSPACTQAQLLQLPDGGVNLKRSTGTRVGVTDIEINWNAPGVKGREAKIWGTGVAPYGFTVLGFGSNAPSPWRAGAEVRKTFMNCNSCGPY